MNKDIRKNNFFLKINGGIYKSNKARLADFVATVIATILLLISSLVIIANKSYDYAIVEGLSMYPTINATTKTTNIRDVAYFSNKKISKGDIVIVNYEAVGDNIQAIKRLVATSGDTICYYDGHILLNGEVFREPYIEKGYEYLKSNTNALRLTGYHSADEWKQNGYETAKGKFEAWCEILLDETLTEEEKDARLVDTEFFKNYSTKYSDCIKYSEVLQTYVLTVPENFVFFMGDNRKDSRDCNSFGPLEKKYLDAKVNFVTSGDFSATGVLTKKILHLFD